MSLFLAYFEIGQHVAPSPLPGGLFARPFLMRFKGRVRVRHAMLLTDGYDSGHFLAYGNHAISLEGERLRGLLFVFLRERVAAGAHPRFVFLWIGGRLDEATIDIEHVARVPICKLEEKLRAMNRFPIMDASEVVEVTADIEGDDELIQPTLPSHVLADISFDNTATEPDPMLWTGNVDLLVDEMLFSVGPSRGSLLLLPSLQALAEAIGRLRQGARAVATTLTGDTASLRFVRRTSGGVHAAVVIYRGVESTPVPVPELDMACGDAVSRFLSGLRPEQRAALKSGHPAELLGSIRTFWPELT